MIIEELDPSLLNEYALNAKKHPEKQIKGIAESIRRFGFVQPVVIDQDNTIVIGHGRIRAAQLIGLKTVPCVRAEGLTKEQIKALRLVDNRIAETGWDIEILISDVGGLDFDFDPFGVEFDSLTNMFAIDDVEAPDLPEGDRTPFQQMTFTVHDSQVEEIKKAIKKASDEGHETSDVNKNSNGNALAWICKKYNDG